MSPSSVEQLLTQDARLLARRDAPVIDKELEEKRQAALSVFYAWQDGTVGFDTLQTFCLVLEKQVKANKELLKWEQSHLTD